MKVGNKVKITSVKNADGERMWSEDLIGKIGTIESIDPNFNPVDSEPIVVRIEDFNSVHGFFEDMFEVIDQTNTDENDIVRFITVMDGIEEGVNLMVEIKEGMEKELLKVIKLFEDSNTEIKVKYGKMTIEEAYENDISSLMYVECCSREDAIEIIEGIK